VPARLPASQLGFLVAESPLFLHGSLGLALNLPGRLLQAPCYYQHDDTGGSTEPHASQHMHLYLSPKSFLPAAHSALRALNTQHPAPSTQHPSPTPSLCLQGRLSRVRVDEKHQQVPDREAERLAEKIVSVSGVGGLVDGSRKGW